MRQFGLALLATAAIGIASPASAQISFGGGGGDTLLQADVTVSENGIITLTGQVDVRQDDVRILSDKMVIYPKTQTQSRGPSLGAAGGDIDRIVATGNFYYITEEQNVRGDKGIYTAATDSFTITGNVVLVQDDSVVRGDRLIYDLTTRKARVLSTCKGRKCGKDRRVAILIKSADTSLAPAGS